jgi:hypothetical protein
MVSYQQNQRVNGRTSMPEIEATPIDTMGATEAGSGLVRSPKVESYGGNVTLGHNSIENSHGALSVNAYDRTNTEQ